MIYFEYSKILYCILIHYTEQGAPINHMKIVPRSIFWPTAKEMSVSMSSRKVRSLTTTELGLAWCGIGCAKLREMVQVMTGAYQEWIDSALDSPWPELLDSVSRIDCVEASYSETHVELHKAWTAIFNSRTFRLGPGILGPR